MPTYNSPGVYVEDVPPISRPIAGVSTSTPGFIGLVPDKIPLPYIKDGVIAWIEQDLASTSKMVYRISSWAEYVALFGDFVGTDFAATAKAVKVPADKKILNGQRYLAHAVYGFFNNGGTNCYVVRIAAENADTASVEKAGKFVATADDLDKALTALSAFDDISTVSFPGQPAHNGSLIKHATTMQRFAILDWAEESDITKPPEMASTYAGVYFPWLKVLDPAEAILNTNQSGGIVAVPPSGHIAGIYARSDAARGAYKAPANEALMGVNALSVNITKAQQDVLNVAGINAIRQLNGALRVWGARTVGKNNGEYRYISTRRYFNYLRQSIDSGTQFVVFEPHTPALWQRVIRTLTDFLTNEWRAGALFGETAKQAFFIKCDAEINPPSTRDQGQLIVEIGVAIVKPAEFVIFRIQQTSGS